MSADDTPMSVVTTGWALGRARDSTCGWSCRAWTAGKIRIKVQSKNHAEPEVVGLDPAISIAGNPDVSVRQQWERVTLRVVRVNADGKLVAVIGEVVGPPSCHRLVVLCARLAANDPAASRGGEEVTLNSETVLRRFKSKARSANCDCHPVACNRHPQTRTNPPNIVHDGGR